MNAAAAPWRAMPCTAVLHNFGEFFYFIMLNLPILIDLKEIPCRQFPVKRNGTKFFVFHFELVASTDIFTIDYCHDVTVII